MRWRVVPVLLLVAAGCAVAAGPEAFGRLLHRAGLPGLALPLISDPAARGAALYELGRYAEADTTFRDIGRSVTYNRGLTLAVTGNYELSADYFDAVLFSDRFDADARFNRDLVQRLVPPVVGEAVGRGRIATILRNAGFNVAALDASNPNAPIGPPDHSVRRPIDARTVAADDAWLDTLADAPGEYLRNRLAAEHDRRRAAGTAAPEVDPW